MNVIAQAAYEYREIKVIAFEIMGNHIHLLLGGEEDNVILFFRFIRKRLQTGLRDSNPQGLPATFSPALREVMDLNYLRNIIVYINRNGYVADPNYTPYSYPWGTGRYYFNEIPATLTLSGMKYTEQREMFRSRKPYLPDNYRILDGYVTPASFCALSQGTAVFRDAHHYFSLLSKNVEALSGIASELGDTDFLTDNELFTKLSTIITKRYGSLRLKDLSKAQKLDLARILHNSFRSSNGQISRVLNLTSYEVNSLFPLSVPKER